MGFLNTFRNVFLIIIYVVFLLFGLFILSAGIMVFLDLNGIIEAPFGYDGGVQTALIYTLVGIFWTGFIGFAMFKTIRGMINKGQ